MNSTSSLGLLSGYNSSSSDEEEEEAAENISVPAPAKVNFFADAVSSSDDEEVKIERTKKARGPLPSPVLTGRLPAPRLGTHSGASPGGVFSNPFQDEQQAQLNILERHVKLSDSNWAKGGRGICLAYQRDGRCRYGTKCKYSHGSDLPPGATIQTQGDLVGGSDALEMQRDSLKRGDVRDGEEEIPVEKGKRKKPGLTNTLIPPKKAMKNYQKQLSSERPWAV